MSHSTSNTITLLSQSSAPVVGQYGWLNNSYINGPFARLPEEIVSMIIDENLKDCTHTLIAAGTASTMDRPRRSIQDKFGISINELALICKWFAYRILPKFDALPKFYEMRNRDQFDIFLQPAMQDLLIAESAIPKFHFVAISEPERGLGPITRSRAQRHRQNWFTEDNFHRMRLRHQPDDVWSDAFRTWHIRTIRSTFRHQLQSYICRGPQNRQIRNLILDNPFVVVFGRFLLFGPDEPELRFLKFRDLEASYDNGEGSVSADVLLAMRLSQDRSSQSMFSRIQVLVT